MSAGCESDKGRIMRLESRIEHLELENGSLKLQLEAWKDTLGGYGDNPENVLNWIQSATTRCILSEAYEKQIQDGELIPFGVLKEWLHSQITPNYSHSISFIINHRLGSIKQFAAERAKNETQYI